MKVRSGVGLEFLFPIFLLGEGVLLSALFCVRGEGEFLTRDAGVGWVETAGVGGESHFGGTGKGDMVVWGIG